MNKKILITWTSKWIWKYLLKNLKEKNEIIGISRSKSNENWFKEFNIDLTNIEVFNNIVKYLEQNDKKLDVIIINAWVGFFWKFEEWSIEKYEEIINLNLLSPILMIKELKPFLKEKTKIIFIWSILSKKFMKYAAVYQASKFGLRWFAGALKNEMKGIHIINPRIVDTDFHNESKIEIEMWNRETKLEDIYNSIQLIIEWKESRFEIDL